MLVKSICKRCINDYIGEVGRWNEIDEHRWKAGKLVCAKAIVIFTTEDPPQACPYYLEHLLKSERTTC